MPPLPALAVRLLLASLFWFAAAPLAAAEEEAGDGPKSRRVGIYLTALRGLDPANRSFAAEFWVWAISPEAEPNPLSTLELVNAVRVERAYDSTQERVDRLGDFRDLDKVWYFQQKINATLFHHWNLLSYPFDRHVLEIQLEDAVGDDTALVFVPDKSNTNFKDDMALAEWRIADFSIREERSHYRSTFGDPALAEGESNYSRLVVSITIERKQLLSFFKLTAGVYAAFVILLLTFFYNTEQPALLAARSNILVGALFAVVVNMRSFDSVLGSAEGFTLVDRIHVLTMVYIFLATFIAVSSRLLSERGEEARALRRDRRILFPLFGISYLLLNILLIARAAWAG